MYGFSFTDGLLWIVKSSNKHLNLKLKKKKLETKKKIYRLRGRNHLPSFKSLNVCRICYHFSSINFFWLNEFKFELIEDFGPKTKNICAKVCNPFFARLTIIYHANDVYKYIVQLTFSIENWCILVNLLLKFWLIVFLQRYIEDFRFCVSSEIFIKTFH